MSMKMFPLTSLLFLTLFVLSCTPSGESPEIATQPVEAFNPNSYIVTNVEGSDLQKAERKAADGSVIEEGFLKNGKKTGTWVIYHPNSTVPKTVISYIDGKYNGIYLELNNRGYLELRADYENNLLDGPWAKYRFGRPTHEAVYEAGKLNGVYREYVPNTGKLQKEITYKDGVMDGPYRFYNEQGAVTLEYEYRNGNKVGGGMTNPGGMNEPR